MFELRCEYCKIDMEDVAWVQTVPLAVICFVASFAVSSVAFADTAPFAPALTRTRVIRARIP